MKIYLLIVAVFVLFSACKSRNKIGSNEKELAAQILIEENEKETVNKEKTAELESVGSANVMRLEENRSVDKKHPPLHLDIPSARNKIRPVRYSDLGKSIRYIYLKHPTDTAFFKYGTSILFTTSNIITITWRGIGRFDLHGQFLEMICKDGQKFTINERGAKWITGEIEGQYVGSKGSISAIGDRVFYKYVDNPNKKAYLMEYDASPQNRSFLLPGSGEEQQMNGKGEIVANLPTDKKRENIIFLDEHHWITKQRKMASSSSGVFMTVHSLSGDTVCTLKDNDPIKNFTSSTYRGVESGDNYRLNGKLHVRQNFNDTIYYFTGTNRLSPKYIIDLGEKGVQSSTEAVTPSYGLKDKFVYKGTVETNDFLFFLYTQDYACPNTAKKGTLKYNRFVLNKNTGEQYHAFINAPAFYPKRGWPSPPQTNIINDLDFGPARWPISQTEEGNIYFQLTGKRLKEHVKKNSSSPMTSNREQLEMFAANCSNDDVFIMIIE